MHYAISTTWGPSDTTRASLPFIFAATALKAGDTVTIMLFHDAVNVAIEVDKRPAYEQMVPCGPGPKFADVFAHDQAEIIVCKPCAAVRGIGEDNLIESCRMGGMSDFYQQVARDDCKFLSF